MELSTGFWNGLITHSIMQTKKPGGVHNEKLKIAIAHIQKPTSSNGGVIEYTTKFTLGILLHGANLASAQATTIGRQGSNHIVYF